MLSQSILFLIIITCVSGKNYVNITNCPSDYDDAKFYPTEPIVIMPEWITDEKHLVYNYNWTYEIKFKIRNKTKTLRGIDQLLVYMQNQTYKLVIPKNRLTPKTYDVIVRSTRKPNVRTGPANALENGTITCKLNVYGFRPVVIITGGYKRMEPPGKDIVVSGEQSYDRLDRNNTFLRYTWTCTQKIQPYTFCNKTPISTKSKFTIPSKFVENGDVFNIKLNARLLYGDALINDNATQEILIINNSAVLNIACKKNCPPATDFPNYKHITFIEVTCIDVCENVQPEDYQWEVAYRSPGQYQFDYNNSRFGRTGSKFIIEKDSLITGVYTVSVTLNTTNGTQGFAAIKLQYVKPANVTNCKISPSQGDTLNTYFKFFCTQTPPNEENFYELYYTDETVESEEQLIVDGIYPDVMERSFRLPQSEGKKFFIRVIKVNHPHLDLPVEANVVSAMQNKTTEEVVKIIDQLYNGVTPEESIAKMVASGDPEERNKAVQIFQSMVNELVISKIEDKEYAEFVELLKYQAAEDMLNAPVSSINEVFKISQSLSRLQGKNASLKSDPLLAKFTTTVCRKMANRALDLIKEEESPLDLADKTRKLSKTMTKCVESSSKADYDLLEEVQRNVTTEKPLFDEPVITEDYPDYIDHDDKYYKNLDNLKETSFNLINTSATTAKILAMTTASGEGLIRIKGNLEETIVFKDNGVEMAKQTFHSQAVTVRASQDFADDLHSYDFLMTTWKRDILWWNPGHIRVATDIASCEFWHSTCTLRVKRFLKPASIYFSLKAESDFMVDMHHYFFNLSVANVTNTINFIRHIKVHRIFLPRSQMLHIKMYNLTSTDAFDVILIENKFPTIGDFAHCVTVTAESNYTLQLFNKYEYDILAYVGIMVNKDAELEGNIMEYQIGSFVSTCIRWLANDSRWTPTCRVGNESTELIIHCECFHFSVVAGYVENILSPLQEVMPADLELKLLSSLIIFKTVLTMFAIFSLLLLRVLFSLQDEIYFLADNPSHHSFAYLIIIRTGLGIRAGTTSNVTINIIGDKSTSEPHVLNYPDPRLRILQMFGHDVFLLATEYYLGEIQKIELWFDSIGTNPSWDCKHITVHDLQEHLQWHFNVNTKFSIIANVTYVEVEPVFKEKITPTIKDILGSVPMVDDSGDKKMPFKKIKFSDFKFKFTSFKFKKMKLSKCKLSDFKPSNFESLLRKIVSLFKRTPELKFRSYYRNHTWFLGRTEDHFSYFKKLTVVFSTIMTTFAVALVFLGLPSLQLKDVLDKNEDPGIGFYGFFVAFASSFLSFMPHICIAWCFRYSQVQYWRYDQSAKLPFFYTMACWAVLLCLITCSTSLLLVFGFWVPQNTAIIWLTSCIVGVVFGAFCYEALFMYLQKFLFDLKIVIDLGKKFHDIYEIVEAQRKYLYSRFGHSLLRPYFEHLYKPLSEKQIKEKRFFFSRRYRVLNELEDLLMFGVYIITLYIVVLANKDNLIVKGRTAMKEIMEGKFTRSPSFAYIDTPADIYDYINKTLIPAIQPREWYQNYILSEPGLMTDMVNKYIGVARLRQHRTKSKKCKITLKIPFLNMTCWPEYSDEYKETRTFGYSWGEFSSYITFDRLRKIWQYSPGTQTATLTTAGEFSAYSGGGYVAYLGRTLHNSYANFRKLLEKIWINKKTRVVFVEFLTYNANYNIFNSVRLTFEQSATGFMYNQIYVYAVRMLFVQSEVEVISTMFLILFIIWVAMLLLKQSLGVYRHLHSFYKDPWLVTDIIIIFLSVVCIICFGVRMTFVGKYLAALEKAKHNEFLSYFYLFYIEDFLTFVAAALVCISTIRLWKFLRFATMFRVLERTLSIAAITLMSFSLVVFLILIASALTLVLLLGNKFRRIYSLMKIIRLLMAMPLRSIELKLREFVQFPVAVSYAIFAMISLEVSVFVFIMIIVKAYAEAQMEFSSEPETYTIKNYVQEQMKYLPKYVKYKYKRLRAGFGETDKVEPKSDKFLYLNSFSLPVEKMALMRCITKAFIKRQNRPKKKHKLSEYEVKLMLELCSRYLSKHKTGEVDVFYKGRVRGRRIKFLDEKKIEKVANVVNYILQEHPPEVSEEEERSPLEKYTKVIRKNQKTLQKCTLSLKLVLHKMKRVEMEVSRHFHHSLN